MSDGNAKQERVLPGTRALEMEGDLAAQMVAGISRFLDRETAASIERRAAHWQRDVFSHASYVKSVEENRGRFRRMIGAADPREPAEMQVVAAPGQPTEIATGPGYRVTAVRWRALRDIEGEGLLLEPEGAPAANVVALPDCDWTPEMLVGLEPGVPEAAQLARRLAENGCRVLVPLLADRRDTYSGDPRVRRTNQPHREFVYRTAFEMGRHVIGYEVQKVLAAVDWFLQCSTAEAAGTGAAAPTHRLTTENENEDENENENERAGASRPHHLTTTSRQTRTPPPHHLTTPPPRVGIIGYGEGGLLALYAASVDTRIEAVCVSGYFAPREHLWQEPIYRNVWALLEEFGDAEIASLVAPRTLVVEACRGPEVSGPPAPSEGRAGAAPGVLTTPDPEAVAAEFHRAATLIEGLSPAPRWSLVRSGQGRGLPGSDAALSAFLEALLSGPPSPPTLGGAGAASPLRPDSGRAPAATGAGRPDPEARMRRQVWQMVEHTQHLLREGEFRRAEFWSHADATNVETWQESCRWYRDALWDEVIGRFPPANVAADPRSRLVYDEPTYRGYEVVLDVYGSVPPPHNPTTSPPEEVFAYGILLLPKDLQPGERRPVVVCQHGLEGRPQDVADPGHEHHAYHQYACRLAERGFVVYAPQNPYIGMDAFRVLQRKLNPLKKSLFSVIVRQHERTLEWLASLPCVDPERIGFYGLSYGGKTAMRVPALLTQYCLSICSADYDEWALKCATTRHTYGYVYSGEYEMFEFDLGNTFNYAEMSWLICPRPFMVERGHHDGVAPDEWVGYEYAKTRRRYDLLGLEDRTELEVFNGPHTINGVGTFEFLHRHLRWPAPRLEYWSDGVVE